SLDRAPGSMCPSERSPRNDARPFVANMSRVASTPRAASFGSSARIKGTAGSRSASSGKGPATGRTPSPIVLFPPPRVHLRVAARIPVQLVPRSRHAEEQRREQRSRRAADRAQHLARRDLQRWSKVERLDVAANAAQRFEPADQVEYVIAVADRLVENHDLVCVLLYRCMRGIDAIHYDFAVHRILRDPQRGREAGRQPSGRPPRSRRSEGLARVLESPLP